MSSSLLIHSISELVTCEPLVRNSIQADVKREDLGLLNNAWIFCEDGKVCAVGVKDSWKSHVRDDIILIDASRKLVLPGLVDSHTHSLYGGDRADEFAKRLNGMTYSEIAEQGGGIHSTVKTTCQTSDEDLLEQAQERLKTFLSYGVTSLEVKSGYSLTVKEELRQLRLLKKLKNRVYQTVKVTSLPLHAVPLGKKSKDYIQECQEALDIIKTEGLADFVDMFIEKNYYEAGECEPFIQRVKELGFGLKIHADEFTNSGGARLAAQYKAVSADHLQFASDQDKRHLAQNQVIATILPGTSLYTKIPFTNAKSFIEFGCRVALASDHNPGSCQLSNLPMLTSLGALHCGMTAAQAVASVTFMGALACGLNKSKGALAKGFDADFQILPFKNHESWLASFGEKKPESVFIMGDRKV